MKHALALSGGGFKGILQVGSVQTLLEQGIKFEAVSGISTGALNGSLIAQGKINQLLKLWLSVKDSEGGFITNGNLATIKEGKLTPDFKRIKEVGMNGVSKWDIVKALTSTFFKGKDLEEIGNKIFSNIDNSTGILDNSPLKAALLDNIKRTDFIMPYYFGLTSLPSGKGWELNNKDFASDKDLVNAILASATMPVIWDSVSNIQTKTGTIKNSVDGGLRTVSPIGMIFDTIDKSKESEDWTIWVINCNSRELPALEDTSRLSVKAGRTLDILLNQVFVDDIERTIQINDIAEQLGKRKVTLNIIEPTPGSVGGTLDARPEIMDLRLEMGRALASNFF